MKKWSLNVKWIGENKEQAIHNIEYVFKQIGIENMMEEIK